MIDWCDDERNVHTFLKPSPYVEKESDNIWKDIHNYLENCSRNKYDDITYVEYEYEPLILDTYPETEMEPEQEPETNQLERNDIVTTELNECDDIDYQKNIYAYS